MVTKSSLSLQSFQRGRKWRHVASARHTGTELFDRQSLNKVFWGNIFGIYNLLLSIKNCRNAAFILLGRKLRINLALTVDNVQTKYQYKAFGIT